MVIKLLYISACFIHYFLCMLWQFTEGHHACFIVITLCINDTSQGGQKEVMLTEMQS
jgi:hypothetical protein